MKQTIFILNVFATEGTRPFSPLLVLSVLQYLEIIRLAAGKEIDRGYVPLSAIASFFEPCGIDPDDVRYVVREMVEFGLIDPFEPTENVTDLLSEGTRLGIAFSGQAHVELALSEDVYLEQMALTTGYHVARPCDEISQVAKDMSSPAARSTIKSTFIRYLLREDSIKMAIPKNNSYVSLTKLRLD